MSLNIVEKKRRRLGIPSLREVWKPEEIALLGTARDREVAGKLGRTTAAVRVKRQSLGIGSYVDRWSQGEIALLGTDTDRAVAKKLGRKPFSVAHQRRLLGIPSILALKSLIESSTHEPSADPIPERRTTE